MHIAERSQAPALAAPPQRRLDDMYGEDGGRTLISGIQAIVRLVLDQRRLDVLRGFRTAAFVSGYEGSPSLGSTLSWVASDSVSTMRAWCSRPQ